MLLARKYAQMSTIRQLTKYYYAFLHIPVLYSGGFALDFFR